MHAECVISRWADLEFYLFLDSNFGSKILLETNSKSGREKLNLIWDKNLAARAS